MFGKRKRRKREGRKQSAHQRSSIQEARREETEEQKVEMPNYINQREVGSPLCSVAAATAGEFFRVLHEDPHRHKKRKDVQASLARMARSRRDTRGTQPLTRCSRPVGRGRGGSCQYGVSIFFIFVVQRRNGLFFWRGCGRRG